MPKLLVSVRDDIEAAAAHTGGADWIDLKEPNRGPLGAVGVATARRAADCVPPHIPLSAALGELADWPDGASRRLLRVERLRYVKLGLAGCASIPWKSRWTAASKHAQEHASELIAVAYGDAAAAAAPEPEEVLAFAAEHASSWLLIDTFDKSQGAIVDLLGPVRLAELIANARTNGMRVAVAGSVRIANFTRLPIESIDMIAVRGAACRDGRESAVDWRCVQNLRQSLDQIEREVKGRPVAGKQSPN